MAEPTPLELRLKVDARPALRQLRVAIAAITALRALRFVRTYWAEILTAVAFIAGCVLVIAGIASAIGAFAPRFTRAVWLLGLGMIAISLGGWRLFVQFACDGIYSLAKDA